MADPTETTRQTAGGRAAQPLRNKLLMLTASCLLPLAVAAAIGVGYLVHDRHQAAQRSALELSRALATAVDAELDSTVAALQTLAHSAHLSAGRLAQFHAQADQIAQERGWRSVQLADGAGTPLLRTDVPFGAALPGPFDAASLRRVIAQRTPVIGRVSERPPLPGSGFSVRVPVLRNGRLVNVLSATVSTDQVLTVLTRQEIPPTWVAGVFDGEGERVARTKLHATGRASPSMQALIDAGGLEGMGETLTLEGVPSFSGFSRLKGSEWVVAVGISRRDVDVALLPLLLSLAGGLLASLGLSAYIGGVFARRVSEPIETLKRGATALGRGQGVALPTLGISELDEVGAALNGASAERDAALAERARSEADRERLLQRMIEALRRAEEAGRSKDEFLAVLGHELRNPLAPITTALHLMERKGDERTQPERQIVQRQVSHMVRLVDDLLDVSRITGKRLTIRPEPLRLAAMVKHVADALRPLLGGRSLQVRVAPDAANAWVRGDEVRVAQVLNNVLGNAVKFTSATGRIGLSMSTDGERVLIVVRDDGIGMPPEVLKRAFEPFFQAAQDMDRPRGGLGLGLAIVESLMEMHGGGVSAASAGSGCGSTVTLSFPSIDQPNLAPPATKSDSTPGAGKVLVVDDNQDAADMTALLLKDSGYEVRVAYEGRTALELMTVFGADAAVLDIGLPGMSGYELAAALRAAPYGFTGLLVALTGYGQQEDVANALRSGFDAHMTKPMEAQALLELMANWMRVRTRLAVAPS